MINEFYGVCFLFPPHSSSVIQQHRSGHTTCTIVMSRWIIQKPEFKTLCRTLAVACPPPYFIPDRTASWSVLERPGAFVDVLLQDSIMDVRTHGFLLLLLRILFPPDQLV
jgi:hypothetical protein